MVRIIAGSFKSRSIHYSKKLAIRPTQDRVKSALFSILGDVSDLRAVDLFAGTGNLGLEALSRGAAYCTFVENDSQNVTLIRRNLAEFGLEPKAEVIRSDVLKYLNTRPVCDLILADPPYRYPYYAELLQAFSGLALDTQIVLETDSKFQIPEFFKPAEVSVRKSGDTNLNFIRV
ncbi:MAG: 16S rRNA (guanine(966)-N(2))-methyltransferase RsmD [Candidatus Neomarinimicrobiota bacterium]